LIDMFSRAGLENALDVSFDVNAITTDPVTRELLVSSMRDARADAMLAGLKARGAHSVFVRYLESLDGHPSADAVLAAITTTLAWGPLMRKRISRLTAATMPWYLRLYGVLLGATMSEPLQSGVSPQM